MQKTEIALKTNIAEMEALHRSEQKVAISIVVPAMNEQDNISLLYAQLVSLLDQIGKPYEIIFVDDGSTDNTFNVMKSLYEEHSDIVRVVRFRKNFGKTPALVAGFGLAKGDVVFTMDGDLQDDPLEIPRYLEKLDEGYDLVTGWKFPRLDPISKTFPSHVFNGLVNKVTGVHFMISIVALRHTGMK